MKNSGTFAVHGRQAGARAGTLRTARGEIATPALCVLDPQGLDATELRAAGVQVVALSLFDLENRHGADPAGTIGDAHSFLGWDGPLLLHAGSGAIFALPTRASATHGMLERIDAEGVTFASPLDGARRRVPPEAALHAMTRLGADLAVSLFPPARLEPRNLDPLALAHQWAERSIAARKEGPLVVLGMDCPTSLEAAGYLSRSLAPLSADAYALAGDDVATFTSVLEGLPPDRPRLLLNAATPAAIRSAVAVGFDLVGWDARNGAAAGRALTGERGLALADDAYRESFIPIDATCSCPACGFSRAYIHHLYAAHELLGPRLVALHNLTFVSRMVGELRASVPGSS